MIVVSSCPIDSRIDKERLHFSFRYRLLSRLSNKNVKTVLYCKGLAAFYRTSIFSAVMAIHPWS